MAITRVNPGDWAVGEKLTSAQANGLDTNGAKAVDKTVAGDTISGELTFDATSSIVMESGSTKVVEVGASLAVEGELAAPSTATIDLALGASGHIDVASGGLISTSGTGAILLGNGTWPTLSSRTRVVARRPGFLASISDYDRTTGGWDYGNGNGVLLGGATSYTVALDTIPHNGATLTNITLYFTPAAHVSLPASNVTLYFVTVSNATGAELFSSTFNYAPGIVATYSNIRQTFSCTLSQVIDTTSNHYVVVLVDEHGANSVVGTAYDLLKFTYTVTDLRFP